MLRKIKANYEGEACIGLAKSFDCQDSLLWRPRSRHIGKRRRQEILLGENRNPNKQFLDRPLVSSVKFDAQIKKREKKRLPEDHPALTKAQSGNTTSSTSTSYTLCDKAKRREYQGNKVYKKQKGGKPNIDTYKQGLKSQRTGKWTYFNLYNESDFPCFNEFSLQLIDNEVDDDWDTDDEVLENGLNYNRRKLLETLNATLEKQLKPQEKK